VGETVATSASAIGSTCEGATAPSSPLARQSVSPAEPTELDREVFDQAYKLLRRLENFVLPDGKRAEISIVIPRPYKPTGNEPISFILNHTANLWRALSSNVFGKVDHKMTGVLKAGEKSKLAKPIERWWSACVEKDVLPAEWLLWEMQGWKKRNPSKPLVVEGLMSARRVLDGRVRYFFRTESTALGGHKITDP
jgi:hypothetical protein